MDTAPACLQRRLLPGEEAARPVSSVKRENARLNPIKRSLGKLVDVVPEASETPDDSVAPTGKPDSPSCDPAPQPVLPDYNRQKGRSHLTVHTLLPEAVIQDSLAALESYYGVPGCTHSPATAAADPATLQPGTLCKPYQQQFTPCNNLPMLNILSLALPVNAPYTHRKKPGHHSASKESNVCLSSSCKGRLSCPGVQGRTYGALSAATVLTTAATTATTSATAHLASMSTFDIQRSVRTGHNTLTMPNRIAEPLQPQHEPHRQASLVGRHNDSVHAGRGTLAPCQPADTNNTEVSWQAGSNNSVSSSGQLTAHRRQLSTVWSNNSSCQEDIDQHSGSPVALVDECSMKGLAQSSSSCKCRATSSPTTSASCQDRKHTTGVSQVAANIAALLHIQLDQSAGGAIVTLQDILQDSPHFSTASDSTVSGGLLVQPGALNPAATATAAVSCKPVISQQPRMQLPLNKSMPESPRASRQPILIDFPRPVCSPRGQGAPGAAVHSTSWEALGNHPGQLQRRPPGAFVGRDPSRVLVAGGIGFRNSVCSCGGSSVMPDPSGRSLLNDHLGRPHAASLVADAAVAGAADTGFLLQHVLQPQPKERGASP